MANLDEPGRPAPASNRWRDERPPSPRVLKFALIAAAIIVVIAIVLYLKARHAPPALHDELQLRSAPSRKIPSVGFEHSFNAASSTGQLSFA